jgi:hypothetical protein
MIQFLVDMDGRFAEGLAGIAGATAADGPIVLLSVSVLISFSIQIQEGVSVC